MARRHAQRARHGITLRVWLCRIHRSSRGWQPPERGFGWTARRRRCSRALNAPASTPSCSRAPRSRAARPPRDRAAVLRLRPAGRARGLRCRRAGAPIARLRSATGPVGAAGLVVRARRPMDAPRRQGVSRPASHADRRRCRSCDDLERALRRRGTRSSSGGPVRPASAFLRERCTSPFTRPSTAPAASRPRTSSGRWPWATTSCGSGRRRSPVSSTRRRRSSRACGSPRRVHGSPPACLCLTPSVTTELRGTTPPPLALGFEQLARAPTLRARAGSCGATSRPSARC